MQPRALGRKASDEFAVPLCRIHHRLVQRVGNEAAWWKDAGIEPVKSARKLWKQTRASDGRIRSDRPMQGETSDRPRSLTMPVAHRRHDDGPCWHGSTRVSSYPTPPPIRHSPISCSKATAKLGRSAASGSGLGCGNHYNEATAAVPSAEEVRSALDLLEAGAQFDGPERAVHVRIAEHAGHIYLDLADEHWRAIDIGPAGWRVIRCPPARFRPPHGMLPLPVPQQGGSIEALNSFLNLATPNDFVLIIAWVLAALRSSGPYRSWRYRGRLRAAPLSNHATKNTKSFFAGKIQATAAEGPKIVRPRLRRFPRPPLKRAYAGFELFDRKDSIFSAVGFARDGSAALTISGVRGLCRGAVVDGDADVRGAKQNSDSALIEYCVANNL